MTPKNLNIVLYGVVIISMFMSFYLSGQFYSYNAILVWEIFAFLCCVFRFLILNYALNLFRIKRRYKGESVRNVTGGQRFLIGVTGFFDSFMGISIVSIYGLLLSLMSLFGFFASLYLSLNPNRIPSNYRYGAATLFFTAIVIGVFYFAVVLLKSKFRFTIPDDSSKGEANDRS